MPYNPEIDFHWKTVIEDKEFHAFMDAWSLWFSQGNWREWPPAQKRGAAKCYNFGKLYGFRSERFKQEIDKP